MGRRKGHVDEVVDAGDVGGVVEGGATYQEVDVEALRAQARRALAAFEIIREECEKMPIGTAYNIHPDLKDWCFVRLGVKSSEEAQAHAGRLALKGWVKCPSKTRIAGFEADRDDGLYMMCPRDHRAALVELERVSKSGRKRIDPMRAAIDDLRGVVGEENVSSRGVVGGRVGGRQYREEYGE